MENKQKNTTNQSIPIPSEKKPNELGGFYFSSFLKIIDPNSKEVILEKRGDD